MDKILTGLDNSDFFTEESHMASQSPLTYYLMHAHANGSPGTRLLIPYTKGVSGNQSRATIPSTNNTNTNGEAPLKVNTIQEKDESFDEVV